MENLKHTKGEWIVTEENSFESTIKTTEGVRIAEAKSFGNESIFFMDATPDERIANAKLISAAPDLLEALILANKLIDELDKASDYRETEFHYETQHKINNAINKATK